MLQLPETGIDLHAHMDALEKEYLIQALERARWVKSQACKILGIQRTTLLMKMRKHKLPLQSPSRKGEAMKRRFTLYLHGIGPIDVEADSWGEAKKKIDDMAAHYERINGEPHPFIGSDAPVTHPEDPTPPEAA